MRKLLLAALVAACARTAAAADDPSAKAFALMKDAGAAYQRGDKATFLKDYEEAARLRPGDVWILYNLACAQAVNGQTAAAVQSLEAFAAHRLVADVAGDADLESLRQTAGYKKVVAEMEALKKERISSGAAVAFKIPEKEVAPEGVAYDPVTKAFFVASVRKGKIVRVGPDGKISDFVAPGSGSGLKSALGIGIDPKGRTLWVASEAIPQMNGAKEGDPPQSALFEFDLGTGKLRKEHRPAASENPAFFDDLTVGADGTVYVNDGRTPRIYALTGGKGDLAAFLETDAMRGTQGLAVTPDGKSLYASDYTGLYRIDVATKKVTRLPVPADLALAGIDGLVYSAGRLVGIQNGIEPHRVIQLDLGPDGAKIVRARILEMNHPDFDEPTLGTVVDGALYFTANNQGHRYYDLKNPYKPEDLRDAVILKLPLGKS
jgi:sugar lactone lactonase YvrE